jgi:KDO2-lipid IV(A) lauroyltransferase
MHNPYVDRWLEKKRLRTGLTIIYKDKAMRKIISTLKQNGMVAMLIDQYIRGQGTPAPFMGQMVETIRTAAGVLHKMDCSAVYAYSLLQADNSYLTIIKEAPAPDIDSSDEEHVLAAYLAAHNAELERWIRRYPSHWFGWLHRRFKGVIDYH